ncbi:hypothetical protein I302_102429 [Kwoniella bestiolae CBS 10118]|uniref:Dynactin 2 n=1 Tax=Kwoniella bestiolae CBS 10118 TaxID=1296100 RepID=A0A1B9GF93_9TREE|nr:hypothetical protein I302_01120 [Kwoniella bestiolae CBS 10118]OCF29611.1 hypothetical protein I302_01120 [Kwoniella bestiolae CBS 10118]
MSSKYHGLPDIDTAQDIFETPDEPDTLLRPADNGLGDDEPSSNKPSSENIDITGLPGRKNVEKVFGRGIRRKDPKDLSFRPRLPPLSRHTLSTYSSSSDDEEPSHQYKESSLSRLRRLKAELAELESEISSQPEASTSSAVAEGREGKRKSVLPPKQPINLISELNGLKDRLGRLDVDAVDDGEIVDGAGSSEWNERLKRLAVQPNSTGEETSESGGEMREYSLGEIDKRLAVLENALGPIGEGINQNGPLLPTLTKHSHLLSLLTQPRQLDAISRRIKLLLVDLDRAASTNKRGPTASESDQPSSQVTLSQAEYQNLQQLFNLLSRLDGYLPIIQPLLIRLKSLNELHTDASTIAESLRHLKNQDKSNVAEIGQLQGILDKLNSGLDGAVQGIMRNWDSTEGRIRGLEERLKVLEQ